jgi:hypothetical protein
MFKQLGLAGWIRKSGHEVFKGHIHAGLVELGFDFVQAGMRA